LIFLTCLEERAILILWICSWDSSKPDLVGFIVAYAAIVHNHGEETKKKKKSLPMKMRGTEEWKTWKGFIGKKVSTNPMKIPSNA